MRILLADDHELIREGLKASLSASRPEIEVLEADNLKSALEIMEAAGTSDFSLIILDLLMPGMDGFAGLDRMLEACGGVPVVILSSTARRIDVGEAMKRGASGYIPKDLTLTEITAAIDNVLAGQPYIPREFRSGPLEGSAGLLAPSPLEALTPREKDVLALLVQGISNKEIARRLELKEVTVKVHLKSIFRKLNAANRTQAAQIAVNLGWRT